MMLSSDIEEMEKISDFKRDHYNYAQNPEASANVYN